VYAKRSCPAGDPCDLLALLHGPHRMGCRLVMILLSQHGWSAATIAELLGCDRAPCAAGCIATTPTAPTALPTGPGQADPGSAAHGWAIVSAGSWPSRGPGPSRCCTALWGHPAISLHTLHRRVREVAAWRRLRLVAKGDPDRDQVLAALRQAIATLPTGAVVLAEDETHLNLLPWVRATWVVRGTRQRVMTPGTNQRRTIFGAVDLHSGRFLYQVCRKAVSAGFTAFCEQLPAAYPTAPVVAVVCDNVIIHQSKIVQAWLASHPRLRVLHGPVTAPTTTRSSASGAPSRPTSPTRPPRPWPGASVKSIPSSALAAPPSCWSPPPPTAPPGSPTDTDRTFGRPLRTWALPAGSGRPACGCGRRVRVVR
jgi:hypothetical protein